MPDNEQLFDSYRDSYVDAMDDVTAFSGKRHEYYVRAKARLLRRLDRSGLVSCAGSLLDVGCGAGLLHSHLGSTFERIVGVDVAGEPLQLARARNPEVEYIRVEQELPFEAATFDVTLAICVVHHVAPDGWRGFVEELRRVTRPGGSVVIIEHNPLNPLTRKVVRDCPFDEDAVLLRAGKCRALLASAGLVEIRHRYFQFLLSEGALADRIEQWLGFAPLGAQYVATGRVPA